MNRPDSSVPPQPEGGWHASPALLAAYASGRTGAVDSWSLEMHLVSCPLCRAELALVVQPGERHTLDAVRARVLSDASTAPQPAAARAGRRVGVAGVGARFALSARTRLVLQPAALAAVVLAVLIAVCLDLLARGTGPAGSTDGGGLLWLLAPALPLGGVALCAVRDGDPWREAVLATPSAGLRLTLWRTLAVLALAMPVSIGVGSAMGAPPPGLWLLPCLALTVLTLALGTVVPLERAAAVVGAAWCALVLGRALVDTGSPGVTALRTLAASATDAPVLGPGAQVLWGAVAVAAALVLAHRRASYEHLLPTPSARSAA